MKDGEGISKQNFREDTTESRRRHRFLEGRDQGIFRTFDNTTIVIHKNSISMKHRLYITLIYLTTGMSLTSLQTFRNKYYKHYTNS
ncbi:unnamed protein product [Gordionus sp. m RMFG-2023]